MGILRRADRTLTKIELDSESYIEVEKEITKGAFNSVASAYPEDLDEKKGLSIMQGTNLQTTLFSTFVKGWSLDGEPSVEEYLGLPRDAAEQIDTKLMEYFSNMSVGEPDAKKRGR